MKSPIDIFPNRFFAAWFWFIIAAVEFAAFMFYGPVVIKYAASRKYAIVLDGSETFHISPVKSLMETQDFFILTAKHAVNAGFMLNPFGPENELKLEQIYLPGARMEALSYYEAQKRDFLKFKIHQKVEISNIRIDVNLSKKDYIVAIASIQLIKTGVSSNDTPMNFPVEHYKLFLQMTENPNLYNRGSFPIVVKLMKLKPVIKKKS